MNTKRPTARTIKGLRLDLDAARQGKTWLLLPEGFRHQDAGLTYPLPTKENDIREIGSLYITPHKRDAGCKYIRRAIIECRAINKARRRGGLPPVLDIGHREDQIKRRHREFDIRISELKKKARDAVKEVREEAQKASASLNELFTLGKKGLEGQMKAHLEGKEWQGEKINAVAFRGCFRLVSQAVKGLGLPSDDRDVATETIMEEVAEALKDTQETVEMAPAGDPEINH